MTFCLSGRIRRLGRTKLSRSCLRGTNVMEVPRPTTLALATILPSASERFATLDPLSVTAGRLVEPYRLNIYAYANNNPLRFIEPSGLCGQEFAPTTSEDGTPVLRVETKCQDFGYLLWLFFVHASQMGWDEWDVPLHDSRIHQPPPEPNQPLHPLIKYLDGLIAPGKCSDRGSSNVIALGGSAKIAPNIMPIVPFFSGGVGGSFDIDLNALQFVLSRPGMRSVEQQLDGPSLEGILYAREPGLL